MTQEIFFEALTDSAKTIPFLLAIYVAIELAEAKFGGKIKKLARAAGKRAVLIGALAGALPQCGFSVVAAALYSQRLITIGALLAVFLSTSDEAVPILLSNPGSAPTAIILILVKIAIAIAAGSLVDSAFRETNQKTLARINAFASGNDDPNHHHEDQSGNMACCGHNATPTAKITFNNVFWHPIVHTAKIFVYIFAISLAIAAAFETIGQNELINIFYQNNWAPILAALIGLIPNCAASVAITEFYLNGLIGFGAAVAGLCASAGLGLLVLFREEKNKRHALMITTILFSISAITGFAIRLFFQ